MVVFGMPVKTAVGAATNGAAFGLFPIGWIVLCAIFVYDITVKTGKFEEVRHTIAGLAVDRRIQVLLIAFSFGAFIEGAAGFGTPIAICAAMLIGLGFRPLPAAGLSLIGNTAPVAFGAIGTPLITLASVTGLPLDDLSAMVGRQLPFFSVIVPFWLVAVMAGFRRTREVWPVCLTAGLSFAVVQFLVSNLHGPLAGRHHRLDGLDPGHGRAAALLAAEGDLPVRRRPAGGGRGRRPPPSRPGRWRAQPRPRAAARSELPASDRRRRSWPGCPGSCWPWLHLEVIRTPPVVPKDTAEKAVYDFFPLSATGTALLLTGIISGLALRLRPGEIGRVFLGTLNRVKFSLLTIAAMLAIGYVTRYGGLDASMGLAFAKTGKLFAFSPLLGWLGVALTGSDTSSNALFGSLQKITAGQIGISPVLAAASNSSGGVMGKMIDAQSIVVGGVATGQEEGNILRYVYFHSIALACLVGHFVLAQAYLFPGVVP